MSKLQPSPLQSTFILASLPVPLQLQSCKPACILKVCGCQDILVDGKWCHLPSLPESGIGVVMVLVMQCLPPPFLWKVASWSHFMAWKLKAEKK